MRHAIRDFVGDLLVPGDPAFDDARRTQNDAVDRTPAVIARCSGSGDVVAALRYARQHGLPVRVRGGGHGPDRFAVDDGALVIDLTPMRAVRVDRVGRRVRVQGGATWREVDAATRRLRPRGDRSAPAVGRRGRLHARLRFGLARAQARARRGLPALRPRRDRPRPSRHGERHEHPDLFWALRGGGPSFGVVTELEFALHPIGARCRPELLAWPIDRLADVVGAYAELMARATDDLGGALGALTGAPFVPEPLRGTPLVAILVVWTGPGEAPIAPLRALRPAFDAVQPMPYPRLQGMFESPSRTPRACAASAAS